MLWWTVASPHQTDCWNVLIGYHSDHGCFWLDGSGPWLLTNTCLRLIALLTVTATCTSESNCFDLFILYKCSPKHVGRCFDWLLLFCACIRVYFGEWWPNKVGVLITDWFWLFPICVSFTITVSHLILIGCHCFTLVLHWSSLFHICASLARSVSQRCVLLL